MNAIPGHPAGSRAQRSRPTSRGRRRGLGRDGARLGRPFAERRRPRERDERERGAARDGDRRPPGLVRELVEDGGASAHRYGARAQRSPTLLGDPRGPESPRTGIQRRHGSRRFI